MERKKNNNKEVLSEVEVSICAGYLARMDKKVVHNSVYNFNVDEYVFIKKTLMLTKQTTLKI